MSDTHPLTLVGAAIAAGGWIFLVFVTSVGADDYGSRAIFNVHRGAIADNVILLGYAVAISGVIASVGAHLVHSVKDQSQIGQRNGGQTISQPSNSYVDKTEKPLDFSTLSFGTPADRAAALRKSLEHGRDGLAT